MIEDSLDMLDIIAIIYVVFMGLSLILYAWVEYMAQNSQEENKDWVKDYRKPCFYIRKYGAYPYSYCRKVKIR